MTISVKVSSVRLEVMTIDALLVCLAEIGVYYDGAAFYNEIAYKAELERNTYESALRRIKDEIKNIV